MQRLFCNPRLLITVPETLQNYQTVRYARKPRKPRWMPTAKSKMFRVPPRRIYPQEETEEVMRLFNNYRTYMKSIRKYLTERYSVQLQEKADTELLHKAFEEDFARCSTINDKWNEKIRIERDARIAEELEEEIEFAKNRKTKILLEDKLKLEEVEEIVKREKQAVSTFITPEMLDAVIEKAINNPVDYNFAIDLEGNKIFGKETKPEEVKVKQ